MNRVENLIFFQFFTNPNGHSTPHQLCIPPLSDGQHCLTANREAMTLKNALFCRQKKS